jgi:hypothetical protein
MRKMISRLAIFGCVAIPLVVLMRSSLDTHREIVIDPIAIDFGDIDAASEVERILTLRNPNAYPVRAQLVADCSCLKLSMTQLVIQPRRETSVLVTVNRLQGDSRDGLHTYLESQIQVSSETQEGVAQQVIPVSARFFEPYVFDRNACKIDGLATSLQSQEISLSAATSEVGRPSIGELPAFIESIEIDWNDEFAAGVLNVTMRPDTPPGNKKGVIELHFESDSAAEGSRAVFRLPFKAYVRAPYRIQPGVVMLGGLLPVDSETISVQPVDDVACSIQSFNCDSQSIRLEQVDERALIVHYVPVSQADPDAAEIVHIELNIRYNSHGITGERIELLPVHISRQTAETPDKDFGGSA